MKVLVFLSLVAVCFSLPNVFVRRVIVGDDGAVSIIATQGKEFYVYKSLTDPTKHNIIFKSPWGTKKIELDAEFDHRDVELDSYDQKLMNNVPRVWMEQGEALSKIFDQLDEGTLDEKTYAMLLSKVQGMVDDGSVRQPVLDALRVLDKPVPPMKKEPPMVYVLKGITQINDINEAEHTEPLKTKVFGLKEDNLGKPGLKSLSPYHRFLMLFQLLQQQQGSYQGPEPDLLTAEAMRVNSKSNRPRPMSAFERFLYNQQNYAKQMPMPQMQPDIQDGMYQVYPARRYAFPQQLVQRYVLLPDVYKAYPVPKDISEIIRRGELY